MRRFAEWLKQLTESQNFPKPTIIPIGMAKAMLLHGKIQPSGDGGFTSFDQLRDDIKEKGVQKPIVISIDPQGIAVISNGNTRTHASLEAELTTIPAILQTVGQGWNNGKSTFRLPLSSDFFSRAIHTDNQGKRYSFAEKMAAKRKGIEIHTQEIPAKRDFPQPKTLHSFEEILNMDEFDKLMKTYMNVLK